MRAVLAPKGDRMKLKSLKSRFIPLGAAIILLSGCSAREQGDVRFCPPGTKQACTCDNGLQGTQVCATSGRKWGNCVCTVEHPDNGPIKDTMTDTTPADPGRAVDLTPEQDRGTGEDIATDVQSSDQDTGNDTVSDSGQ